MRALGIIQCRLGSTRLPGKTLTALEGETVLGWTIRRAQRMRQLDHLLVATTEEREDDAVADVARERGCDVLRGSVDNVLSRYVTASEQLRPDVMVRITADNPLTEPSTADRCIERLFEQGADYCYTARYPVGTGVDAFTARALEEVAKRAARPTHLEHINAVILENYLDFAIASVAATGAVCRPDVRVTLDTVRDLEHLGSIFERLDDPESAGLVEIVGAHDAVATGRDSFFHDGSSTVTA